MSSNHMNTKAEIRPRYLNMGEPMCKSATLIDCPRRKTCWRHTTHTPLEFQEIRLMGFYKGGKSCRGYIEEPK